MTDSDRATLRTIATMLGWVNIPPQATFENHLNALRARLENAETEVSRLTALLDEAKEALRISKVRNDGLFNDRDQEAIRANALKNALDDLVAEVELAESDTSDWPALLAARLLLAESAPSHLYQAEVSEWMLACFGPEVSADITERVHRFVEEALELAQALGGSGDDAHRLVDYVFGRPVGEVRQEVGGVLVTLAALCTAADVDMQGAGERELDRVWTKIDAIREKQRAKPHGSPLPVAQADGEPGERS